MGPEELEGGLAAEGVDGEWGGFVLGEAESIGSILFLDGLGIPAPAQLKNVIAFTILVMVLMFRPQGILGERLVQVLVDPLQEAHRRQPLLIRPDQQGQVRSTLADAQQLFGGKTAVLQSFGRDAHRYYGLRFNVNF